MDYNFDLNCFFEYYDLKKSVKKDFDGFEILDVCLYTQSKILYIKIKIDNVLPFSSYELFKDYFYVNLLEDGYFVELNVEAKNGCVDVLELYSYIQYFRDNISNIPYCDIRVKDNFCTFILEDDLKLEDFKIKLEDLSLFLKEKGISYGYNCEVLKEKSKQQEVKIIDKKVVKEREEKTEEKEKTNSFKKFPSKNKTVVKISELDPYDSYRDYSFEAQVFKIENMETKTNKIIQTLYVSNEEDALCVKRFENSFCSREQLNSISENKWYQFNGKYRYDEYSKENIFFPNSVFEIEKNEVNFLVDEEENKRIELDVHTKRSEHDGVCDADELIEAAFKMGHKAVAITDHCNCQAFPLAQKKVNEILKNNPDSDFKVIYGAQLNVVDDDIKVIRNPDERSLTDVEYVVFDLETTGLSCYYDHIIEFGAVIYGKNNVEQVNFFIKPPIKVPTFIQEKTHIYEKDLEGAISFQDAVPKILEVFKDRVLVAHNASFDYNFLNYHLTKNGYGKLTNPTIDTLNLSKVIFDHMRSYRLGMVAKKYKISYDEEVAHRADYDAEILLEVFKQMLKELRAINIETLNDLAALNNLQNERTKNAYPKIFSHYCNCLVKNKKGLKDLFKLISIAHTDQLASNEKVNKKEGSEQNSVAEARVYKTTLSEYRSDLLLGSSTNSGDVFEAAAFKTPKDLENSIAFYDYIELQPIEYYQFLIDTYKIRDYEILKDIYRRIIAESDKQNKLVVATGDVHYVNEKQKIYREVYINSKAVGGVVHPLYIFNRELRERVKTPTQFFYNTKMMKQSFSFLNDDKLVEEIVVLNTHKIADQIDFIKPIHDKLFTPQIENSDKLLSDIVYKKAHQLYGEKLDPIISQRIDKELNSIIKNGYGVIYYVAHLLVKKSNEDGYLVGSRGSVGSSFIATLAGITEVNPLEVHYRCPSCLYLQWAKDQADSGYDLPDKNCPCCGKKMIGDGQNIPFETFLGFNADKIPDIDLNFSSEYQDKAHLFTREVFGENNVFRAGTISTYAEKTAMTLVREYFESINKKVSKAYIMKIAKGCQDVKKTTGQHPGGIIVIPDYMDVYDFTPIQYPANSKDAVWKTTHFDFHEIHDNVLKFDILGHVDPSAMRLLYTTTGIDPLSIPLNDPKALKLFSTTETLDLLVDDYQEITGACGLPEFGTKLTRAVLEITKPKTISELIQVSGLTHGTGVWKNNAKDLIMEEGILLKDVIGCRDDIMTTLIRYGLAPKLSFDIMESVRKGKGLKDEFVKEMKKNNVPDWYINSCTKINYMFPKAHAVAYVIMALRIAWYKIYRPIEYYISFLTLRAEEYELETMLKEPENVKKRLDELIVNMNDPTRKDNEKKKDRKLFECLEVFYEMQCRGYRLANIDLNRSLAKQFIINPDNPKQIIPPFIVISGLGEAAGQSIVDARMEKPFISVDDVMKRTGFKKTQKEYLKKIGIFKDLPESAQMTLF